MLCGTLGRFTLVSVDRIEKRGQKKGWRMAVFVDDRLGNYENVTMKVQCCCKDNELLVVNMMPHYLQQDFY